MQQLLDEQRVAGGLRRTAPVPTRRRRHGGRRDPRPARPSRTAAGRRGGRLQTGVAPEVGQHAASLPGCVASIAVGDHHEQGRRPPRGARSWRSMSKVDTSAQCRSSRTSSSRCDSDACGSSRTNASKSTCRDRSRSWPRVGGQAPRYTGSGNADSARGRGGQPHLRGQRRTVCARSAAALPRTADKARRSPRRCARRGRRGHRHAPRRRTAPRGRVLPMPGSPVTTTRPPSRASAPTVAQPPQRRGAADERSLLESRQHAGERDDGLLQSSARLRAAAPNEIAAESRGLDPRPSRSITRMSRGAEHRVKLALTLPLHRSWHTRIRAIPCASGGQWESSRSFS